MGRIVGDTAELERPDFRETAGRLREANDRPVSMHETSDNYVDPRNTARHDTSDFEWRRPTNLEAPPARPGYVQRWVRANLRSEGDNNNWQLRMREGWTPRDPATVPEADAFFGTAKHNGQGVIAVGGLILCEMDERRIISKRNAIREMTRRQENSVSEETDKISREGVRQGAAPIVREDTTHVSTGRRPATMAD